MAIVGALVLQACASTPPATPRSTPPQDQPQVQDPKPPAPINPAPVPSTPVPPQPNPIPVPAPEPTPTTPHGFNALKHWQSNDPAPALEAFKKTCALWESKKEDAFLKPDKPEFGTFKDWKPACQAAKTVNTSRENAIAFFQAHFEPVLLSAAKDTKTLMTGYYIPEIEVRAHATPPFTEPILTKPKTLKEQNLPRNKIKADVSGVLAYGQPVDVFFMQVQGSGRLRFKDGHVLRAAFDGHNSKPYVSIGKYMIQKGYLSKDKASKQDIENWFKNAGEKKTRDIINQNPRYVFFKGEKIDGPEAPRGAQGVPLTALGSLAIDNGFYPYGLPVWIETKIPQHVGDYVGKPTGLLLNAQDTGGAIKGEIRGDIFFGVGKHAGELAGVMKHEARWHMLLPVVLAYRALIG